MDWVINQIETDDRDIIYSGAEPSMGVRVETKFKYKIKIEKIGYMGCDFHKKVCSECKTPNFCKSNIDRPCVIG